MRDAFGTGRRARQPTGQIGVQRLADRSSRSGGGLDTGFMKKGDGTPAHAAADHHLGALLMDERGNLSRLMRFGEGIGHHLSGPHRPLLLLGQHEIGGVPEMLGHGTVESLIGFSGYSDLHTVRLQMD